MKTTFRLMGATLLGGAVLASATSAFALGFRNPDQDARATGQGEAFVAQADDASAIYYNPSGLSQLNGTQITSGGYLDFGHSSYNGPASSKTVENNSVAFLPNFYMSTDFGLTNSPFRFGIGCNVPFGEETDLGKNGPFRYLVTQTSLTVYDISPAVSYKVNESLSIGAALNIYHGHIELERNVNLSGLGLPDGHFEFEGDGNAVGATAGLQYKFLEKNTVGLVYRSPFTIDFANSAKLKDEISAADSGPSAAHASIPFPQSVAGGYAFRPVPQLKLEVDVEWTDWNSLNTVNLHSGNPAFDSKSNPTVAVPFNWKDGFYYEAGAQYDLTKRWVVRAGYIYSENTVPNTTFSPSLPDANRHIFSVGLGFAKSERLQMDAVYQFSYAPERTVTGSPFGVADGKWQSFGNAVMMTTTLKF